MNRGLRPQPALSVLFGGPWLPSQTTKTPSGAILTIRDPVPPDRKENGWYAQHHRRDMRQVPTPFPDPDHTSRNHSHDHRRIR